MYQCILFRVALVFMTLVGAELVAQEKKSYQYAEQGRRYAGSSQRANHYQPQYEIDGQYRQPTAIVMRRNDHALVATKLTGEIFDVDLGDRSMTVVIEESGRQFAKMILLKEDLLAVTDPRNEEVIFYQHDLVSDRWETAETINVPGSPNGLFYDSKQMLLWVTSLWGQRLFQFKIELDGEFEASRMGVVDLPMCGGQVICLPQHKVVFVTDAFGCDFVAIDQRSLSIVNHARLYEHNICQIVSVDDGESILFPQQLLNELSAALQTDITWGNFLSNNLRWLKTERLLSSSGAEIYNNSRFVPIGLVGNGAGDPTSIAITEDELVAVTIGGASQVAIGSLQGRDFRFIDVGYHPVDCEFSADGSSLVVVNQFSDSLAFVDLANLEVQHVSLGPVRAPTAVERGEQLFHDSTLSHDGWMSCQSCHSGGHTNGLLTDNFTDQSYRSPKRVLSLLGQRDTAPYSWAGTMKTLEDQIAFSIRSTMASDHAVQSSDVDQIAAYVRTLERPPSIHQARADSSSSLINKRRIRRGEKVFHAIGCVDCHREPLYTSTEAYDVGLQDERSMRDFNPPSLIAISQRQNSLLHDGRAKSIRDVIENEKHQVSDDVSARQRNDLIRFLESL